MMNNILLNEIYDFEFRARWKSGTRFIVNSAWQGKFNTDQNIFNTKYLRVKMKEELNLDILRVTGKYAETLMPVECMISFPSDDVDDEMIKRFFYYYGRKFNQNCIFLVDANDLIWILPTRPSSTYGQIGKLIKWKRFVYQDLEKLLAAFMKQTYELDKILIPFD